ncbi:MAG: hypothetical protein MJZ54_03755 [Bacteroidaceae bacterium]|nr:hypothetical protein [Bacteroidaceae bacterium]
MKKYIIPAVDVTALHVETSVLLNSVPVVTDPDQTVGGPDDEGPGQLTNGWSYENWTRGDE